MQTMQKTYDQIFEEIKAHLENLSKSESYPDFLQKENEINSLYQKFSFLKIAHNTNFFSIENVTFENSENQSTSDNFETNFATLIQHEIESLENNNANHDIFDDIPEVEEVNSFAEIDEKEHLNENVNSEMTETNPNQENNDAFSDETHRLEPMQDSQFSFVMPKEEKDDFVDEQKIAEEEKNRIEQEEKRRRIVEFSRETTPREKTEMVELSEQEQHDKKFKLANIKGLKVAKTLFDDDPLEQEETPISSPKSGSLLKNNVSTDYMEAPKPKPDFKLDLNDRIAFSQHLFGGSQSELNEVVNKLNSFTTIEKAQEFLSDIYYEKDWKKVDNYAQRLWTLVENRFL